MLRQQGITLIHIGSKNRLISLLDKIHWRSNINRDLLAFIRQLSTLLSAGIPLLQAILIISKSTVSSKLQKILKKIAADITAGQTFASALLKHPRYFNAIFCSLVAAGEKTGCLDSMLWKLTLQKEKMAELKTKLGKALIYPIAVFVVAIFVTLILLLFVVPVFKQVFSDFGAHLPWFTQCILRISEALQKYHGQILIGCFSLTGIAMALQKHSVKFSNRLQWFLHALPLVGKVLKSAAIARFSRVLALNFSAGIPFVEALKMAAPAAGQGVFYQAAIAVSRELAKGETLYLAMRKTEVFPEMYLQMVHIGEESGAFESILNRMADFYEQEVENLIVKLTSLCEPFIMLLLSVIVGSLVIAMYLPLFRLGSVYDSTMLAMTP
jgi:type IV pilus assembly protein PilC